MSEINLLEVVKLDTDEQYSIIQKFQVNYEEALKRAQLLWEKLEVAEKKRADILSQNKDVLLSKLELEKTLKLERRRL